jgi:hypothetical protein
MHPEILEKSTAPQFPPWTPPKENNKRYKGWCKDEN